MRAIIFSLLLSLGVFVSSGQAEPRTIALDLSGQSPFKVYQNAPIKVSNPFQVSLYDFTVTKSPFPKEIISVSEVLSGQTFDLSFSKVGAYKICFSKEKNEAQTCLQLDVQKRIAA